jgi:hypothetical protein
LTKEHLLSKPVSDSFGVDRSAAFGLVDANSGAAVLTTLDDVTVKAVCMRCNNTWMNALEHEMADVAGWTKDGASPLSADQLQTIRRWLMKTYIALSAMVGHTRHFMDRPSDPGVIPTTTRARQIFNGDPAAFDGMRFGLARPHITGEFAYAFGNPTVIPLGPGYANVKSAGLAIVTLGSLQTWVVDPIFHSARITFPKDVMPLEEGLSYNALRGMARVPSLDSVVVDNGEHDIDALFDGLFESGSRKPPTTQGEQI